MWAREQVGFKEQVVGFSVQVGFMEQVGFKEQRRFGEQKRLWVGAQMGCRCGIAMLLCVWLVVVL